MWDDVFYLNDIIEDCRLIVSNFQVVVFNYVWRSGNRVAHGLAELAQSLEFQVLTCWMDKVHFSTLPLIVLHE